MEYEGKNSEGETLREFLDISVLQELLNSFSSLTNIATAILDLKGNILTASSWQTICTKFHRKNAISASKCLESDTLLAGQIAKGEKYNIYRCKNGLIDVAVPILIDNTHVGNLFIGQFLFEPPDFEFFTRQAEKLGFDRDSYLDELTKVPVFSQEQVKEAMEFLTNLTTLIGRSGKDRKKLFELNRQLEKQVQERTAELADSHERLRVLAEASFEGILISENSVIIEANNTMAKMFGYEQAIELVGIKATNLVPPEKRKDVEQKILSGYAQPYETLGLKRNGDIFPIEVHAKMFRYQGRRVRGTAIRDLTERKKAEDEIKVLRGILPICSICRKVRNDEGYYEQIENYLHKRTGVDFSHTLCHRCLKKHYPEQYKRMVLLKNTSE